MMSDELTRLRAEARTHYLLTLSDGWRMKTSIRASRIPSLHARPRPPRHARRPAGDGVDRAAAGSVARGAAEILE
jgi:hypothetical protein